MKLDGTPYVKFLKIQNSLKNIIIYEISHSIQRICQVCSALRSYNGLFNTKVFIFLILVQKRCVASKIEPEK